MGEYVIACALEREIKTLQKRLGPNCRYLVTGVGAHRTRISLEAYFKKVQPSAMIFTGTAGQLDPSLDLGDVVFPSRWVLQGGHCFDANPDLVARLRGHKVQISGSGLTVNTPITRRKSREQLFQALGASICDMESAIALQIADLHEVPAVAPKVVSDTGDSGLMGFWKDFDASMLKLGYYLENLLAYLI